MSRQLDQHHPGGAAAPATPTCCSCCSCFGSMVGTSIALPLVARARADEPTGRTARRVDPVVPLLALAPLAGFAGAVGVWSLFGSSNSLWSLPVSALAGLAVTTVAAFALTRRSPKPATGRVLVVLACYAVLWVLEFAAGVGVLFVSAWVADAQYKAEADAFYPVWLWVLYPVAAVLFALAMVALARRMMRGPRTRTAVRG